jgi:carboxypeptidase Taq
VTAASELADYLGRLSALERVAGLLGWDQETQMPLRGAAQRGAEAGAVAAAIHGLASDPRLADLCDAAEAEGPDLRTATDVREARRMHARATRVPATLASELAAVTSQAQGIWARARAAKDFAGFAPTLAHVVLLKRSEAACLAAPGQSPYNALIDDFEPGMTAEALAEMFAALRPGLVDLRGRIAEVARPAPQLAGTFDHAPQLALSRRIGEALGYDWSAGRLDLAVHPFCSGRLGDVRITTRVDAEDPLGNIYSTVHELGHALYEQGLDPEIALTPAGAAASMGVHESQSRLYENQIGRSRAFAQWLYPQLTEAFGDVGLASAEELHRANNAVATGFIRTEADEVHYNLHVMMRFELERALISGALEVEGLEAAWNARFLEDFGAAVPDAAQGVLQDVHWSVGLFGYFPTYTLGNVYAATLDAAIRAEIPDLDEQVAAGEFGALLDWLRPRVHRRGKLAAPETIIAEAAGRKPEPAFLIAALERKFGELYDLG